MGWLSAIAPAVSGGSGILGSLLSYNTARDANQSNIDENAKANLLQQGLQKVGNEFSAAEAEKARAFDERMSSTAFQRAADDMKAAGLNPMLAAGNASSSPNSPSPSSLGGSAGAARVQAVPSFLQGISATAMEVGRMLQDMQESNSRIALNSKFGEKAVADAGLSRSTAKRYTAEGYISELKRDWLDKVMSSAKEMWRNSKIPDNDIRLRPGGEDQGLSDLYGPGGYE